MKQKELKELCLKSGVSYNEVLKWSNLAKSIYKKELTNKKENGKLNE